MTQEKNEVQKENDRLRIRRQDMESQIEAHEDLIASLEETLEEQKFQIKALVEQLNETGEKHQTQVESLMNMNKEFQEKAESIEQRVQEAHERYVKQKTGIQNLKESGKYTQQAKRCSSDLFREAKDSYTSKNANQSLRDGRNISFDKQTSKNSKGTAGNRSHSSSYAFLHLTKDLESIYREFEAGEINELNKLRRLVSHFRGLSRRTQV